MIHPILLYGDPMLTQKSAEIPKNFPKIKLEELINDMFETMHKANGVGLSAIQIGIPYRIFVVEAHLEKENFHFRNVFINPYIKKEWEPLVKYSEGCLSVPYVTTSVSRPQNIELDYYDQNLNHHIETFKDFKARIIQHEMDHMEGEIFIDKIDQLWKKALENSLQMIKNRKITVAYLTK